MPNIDLPLQRRDAELRAATFDDAARTVDLIWSSGAVVRRSEFFGGAYDEELLVERNAVRLGRLNSGAPLLNTHRLSGLDEVLGAVVPGSARLMNGQGIATVKLSGADAHDSIVQNVRDGILRAVSVGYRVHAADKIDRANDVPLVKIKDWEPYEISLVPIGADPEARVRSSGAELFHCEVEMQTSSAAGAPGGITTRPADTEAERARSGEITRLGEMLGRRNAVITPEFVRGFVDNGSSVQAFRDALLERLVQADEASPPTFSQVRVGPNHDPRRAVESALALRLGVSLPEEEATVARQLMARNGGTLLDLGRSWIEGTGGGRARDRDALVDEMLTVRDLGGLASTSDFPVLLAGAGRRFLMQVYQALASPLLPLTREVNVSDFREVGLVSLSEFPELQEVNEHGEVTRGSLAEGQEKIKLRTFARIVGFTRQALINDDLSAISDRLRVIGRAAADLVATLLADLLTANGGLGATMADGNSLYHATHNNLVAGDPALDVDGLSAARLAMRSQVGPDGRPINVTPRWLVVSPDNETIAEQLLATIAATTVADVNPFSSGRLNLAVDPRLFGRAWRLLADPDQLPVLRIAYLSGQSAPQVSTRQGFDVFGTEVRVSLDVGAALSDFRGTVYSSGIGS